MKKIHTLHYFLFNFKWWIPLGAVLKYMTTISAPKNSYIPFGYVGYVKCVLAPFTISPSGYPFFC